MHSLTKGSWKIRSLIELSLVREFLQEREKGNNAKIGSFSSIMKETEGSESLVVYLWEKNGCLPPLLKLYRIQMCCNIVTQLFPILFFHYFPLDLCTKPLICSNRKSCALHFWVVVTTLMTMAYCMKKIKRFIFCLAKEKKMVISHFRPNYIA